MYGSTDRNVLRTRTSPGPGSGTSISTVRKFAGVGVPVGREARWTWRVVVVMASILTVVVESSWSRRGAQRRRAPGWCPGLVVMFWGGASGLEAQRELHLAGRVHGRVEHLVVQEERGALVEVDLGAVLVDGLVAGLGGFGGADGERRLRGVLGGDPETRRVRESGLGRDVLDDRAGVLGEGEHDSPSDWRAGIFHHCAGAGATQIDVHPGRVGGRRGSGRLGA